MVYLNFIPCDIPYFLVYTMVYYTFFIHVIQYGIPKLVLLKVLGEKSKRVNKDERQWKR